MTENWRENAAWPQVRVAEPDDMADVVRLDGRAFGVDFPPTALADRKGILKPENLLLAIDEGTPIGAAGQFDMEMTLPGGASLPVAAVTWVSVASTHRRRGVLRALMSEQLRRARNSGLAMATLMASESSIYERFGYGAASHRRGIRMEMRQVRFRPGFGESGIVRFVDVDEARKLMPPVFEEWRRRQPGAMSRSEAWWDFLCLDVPERRGDMTGAFYAVWRRDASSPVEGFVRYRLKGGWRDGLGDGRVEVLDACASCDEAEAALWRYLVSIDLMANLEMFPAPIDHPLEWWLVDRRQLRTDEFIDDQWVRLLDIPRSLSSRRYATSDAFTIEVQDELLADNSGTYRIEGSIDGATCERISGAGSTAESTVDLCMNVSALGSLYLGGVRASSLHRGGQIESENRTILARADAFFGAEKEPFNPTMY